MTINTIIPIIFGAKPGELPAQLVHTDGTIHLITASVDNVFVRFVKDSSGWFKRETGNEIDTAYLDSIEAQLNRMFR